MRAAGWEENSRITDAERQRIDDSIQDRADRQAEIQRRREARQHPVFLAAQSAAGGTPPSPAELDALNLSGADRRKLEANLGEVSAARDDGELQLADDIAEDGAVAIIEKLPEAQQSASYLEVEEIDNRGPRELAEGIQQW